MSTKEAPVPIVTQSTIDQYRKMPDIIAEIQAGAAVCDFIEGYGVISAILARNHYILSPRQTEVLYSGLLEYQWQRSGAQYAGTDEGKAEAIAEIERINEAPGSVQKVYNHPTSVTFALDSKTFKKVWGDKESLPVGFTDKTKVISTVSPDGYIDIRYSLVNGKITDGSVAAHEDQHVRYRYFHPESDNEAPNDEKITATASENYRNGDTASFIQILRKLSGYQFSVYLNELTAESLERNGVINQFTNSTHIYANRHKKRIDALRAGLPADFELRLPWERLIWEEELRLAHKMKFVEERYKKIAATNIPTEQLTSILLSLPPDQAYMIELFNPENADSTPEDIPKWAREFFNGWRHKNPIQRSQQLSWFFIDSILAEVPFSPGLSSFADGAQDHKLNLLSGRNEGVIDPESYVAECRKTLESRLPLVDLVEDYIKENLVEGGKKKKPRPVLQPEQLPQVRRMIIEHGLNIDKLFYSLVDRYHDELHHIFSRRIPKQPDVQLFEQEARRTIYKWVRRSLEIDDAIAEVMEQKMNGEQTNLDVLFAPGYRRSSAKYENIIDILLSSEAIDKIAPDISPHDRYAVFLFRCLFHSHIVPADRDGRQVNLLDPENNRPIISLLSRILIWARDESVSNPKIDQLSDNLKQIFGEEESLPAYQEFVGQEFGIVQNQVTSP